MLRSCGGPRTVVMKSMVLLGETGGVSLLGGAGRGGRGVVPEILVNPYLDADAPTLAVRVVGVTLLAHRPAVSSEVLPRGDDHVPHELALLHEGSAERLGACPGLRAAAVEVDARGVGGDEGGGASELEGDVGAELDDGGRLGAKGGDGEV